MPLELFTTNEARLLKILGRKKRTTTELAEEFYEGDLPLDANNKITNYIRRINIKCDWHKLNFTIEGKGAGRAGRTVWKEGR